MSVSTGPVQGDEGTTAALLIRDARLSSGEVVDIAVADGTVRAAGTRQELKSALDPAAKVIDAGGRLLLPAFVNLHAHLDKAFTVGEGRSPGNLREAIAQMRERKRRFTREDVAERASRLIRSSIRSGVTRIRSHVDVDPVAGLVGLEGVLAARDVFANECAVQIVAFPQEGLIEDGRARRLMRRAVETGADLVGGMPHHEDTVEAQRAHVAFCFDLAEEFDADIDMHVDESDDGRVRTLETVADAALARGWHGRVTVAHVCSLSAADDAYSDRVIRKCRDADITVVVCPTTNLVLQGRADRGLVRRGLTRVGELRAGGVRMCLGQDNVCDPFYPLGRGDLLEVAFIAVHAAHLTADDDLDFALRCVTSNPAEVWRAAAYGVRPGAPADLILYQAESWAEALRLQLPPALVLAGGRPVGGLDWRLGGMR